MNSVWTESTSSPQFEQLKKDIKTDVLIIGGGMAGILCGYMLKERDIDCVIVEAERICGGITKNTTAKITVQHGLIYDKIIREFDKDTAQMYYRANKSALERYKNLCKSISCDFEEKDSYVYTVNKLSKIEKELRALEEIDCPASFLTSLPLPFSVSGAIGIKDQAQFHPLKFAYAIAKDLRIYEKTKVLELIPNGAITGRGKIYADKIVVATHFPFINKHGLYFLKMYQHRSYVLGLKNASNVQGMFVDESKTGMSFRNHRDLLLLGGGSHRTGEKGGCWQELEEFAQKYYPKSEIVYKWATQDCMTLDGIPYIGRYSNRTSDLYVATGFNKWGMTSAMVAAKILSDMLTGKENPFASVFSPSRTILRAQLAANASKAILNLLTPTVPRCPHLGCALKYNSEEHSWDCPCHGSRFTEDKKLIDNPATDGLK